MLGHLIIYGLLESFDNVGIVTLILYCVLTMKIDYIGSNDVQKSDKKILDKKEITNLRGRSSRRPRPGFSDSFSNIGN